MVEVAIELLYLVDLMGREVEHYYSVWLWFQILIEDLFVGVFECYVLEYLRGYLVYIVTFWVLNCGVGYFLDVVQILGEVLRKYSNLIVKGYLMMIVLNI